MPDDTVANDATEDTPKKPKTLEERVAELIRLDAIATALSAKSSENGKLIGVEKEAILELMAASGVQKITMLGKTAYFFRQLWAKVNKGVTKEDACKALKSAGLGTMVAETFNSSTLSSHIRQLDKDENDDPILPPELAAAIGWIEKLDIRLVSAKAK